ncbi:hypothetical protein ACJ73_10366, partial [Blastomyces percursus]
REQSTAYLTRNIRNDSPAKSFDLKPRSSFTGTSATTEQSDYDSPHTGITPPSTRITTIYSRRIPELDNDDPLPTNESASQRHGTHDPVPKRRREDSLLLSRKKMAHISDDVSMTGDSQAFMPHSNNTVPNQQRDLANELARLQEQLAQLRRERIQASPVFPMMTTTAEGSRKPRPTLPDCSEYDHSDSSHFPFWKLTMQGKLAADSKAIGGDQEKAWYVLMRLKGKAGDLIFPWVEMKRSLGAGFTADELLEQMEVQFGDPARAVKALNDLNELKQGRRRLDTFLPKFTQLLITSGCYGLPDHIKKGYLRSALNLEIM